MIFQAPIDLEVKGKEVQAIIDLDTGFIGFTEQMYSGTVEYNYQKSPIEFREAFLEKIEPLCAKKILGNFEICRKNEKMKRIQKIIFED